MIETNLKKEKEKHIQRYKKEENGEIVSEAAVVPSKISHLVTRAGLTMRAPRTDESKERRQLRQRPTAVYSRLFIPLLFVRGILMRRSVLLSRRNQRLWQQQG